MNAVNLTDPELMRDPFGGFARVREEGPMVRASFPGEVKQMWLVTRYEDVKTVLGDTRFVNNPASVPGMRVDNIREQLIAARGIDKELATYIIDSILDVDGPDHIRLRRLVSREFTARRVMDLRPRMAEITGSLLDRLDRETDLIENFAYPLPITVICELVGVPEEDRPAWRDQGRAMMTLVPGGVNEPLRRMVELSRDLIERRRAEPGGDLLSALIRTHDEDGDRLSDIELITMLITLVLAGHETTAHLIGNGTLALLTHPDQLDLVKKDPGLWPRAVHELMRWCGPVHGTRTRYAAEDVEIDGQTIKKGEGVIAILVSANLDPRRFGDPERLDLTREQDSRREVHVGFGHGLHYCLGAALARNEAEIAFNALFSRFPDLALAGEPERQYMPMSWRLASLPVRLS
ncbi:cytochrome P450 family protein [Nonomuraea phyllanthi]|uniref:cytochrome P450 family protein n=1 Tax=Nonomuraea phyllanthi TaxID=2219224 RepID=UPI001D13A33C|nr:cytochrome P450 [Nonomuraea phyllanthi]